MKISSIAKAILLPTLMLPLTSDGAKVNEKKDRVIPLENRVFPEIDPLAASTLLLPRNVDPMSLALLGLSRKLDGKNYIKEVIVDPKRFSEEQKKWFDTYYEIDTENKGYFYISRYKNARPDSMFGVAYDEEERQKGLIFPKAPNEDTPVTIIPAKEAGLPGVFKVFEKNDAYEVKYDFHSMIWVPDHSKVGSTYLVNLENSMRKLPKEFTKELSKQGTWVLTGADYKDVYYHYYPHWKNEDDLKEWDPNKPVYEIRKDGSWIDRRKWMHVGGLYIDKRAIIPQTYVSYYTGKTYDYAQDKGAITRVLYHELGHGLDYAHGGAWSDEAGFRTAHKADIKTFTQEDKDNLVYFYRSRSETFAHVTAALLGGLSKDESARILSKLKNSAEHVRQDVFPRFKIEISVEQIRRDIYPDYLKKTAKDKAQRVGMRYEPILIPDMLLPSRQ